MTQLTQDRTGYFSIYLNNFGGRRRLAPVRAAMQREVDDAPSGIIMLQEYDGYPSIPEGLFSTAFDEDYGIFTAVRHSLGQATASDRRSFTMDSYNHQGRRVDCYS